MTTEPLAEASPQQTAERVRDHMFANDRASQGLGMDVVAGRRPARAAVTMTVRDDMLNGHGTCHGGLLTTLADSAFAFACNSYNELTVASGFTIDFVAPARARRRAHRHARRDVARPAAPASTTSR